MREWAPARRGFHGVTRSVVDLTPVAALQSRRLVMATAKTLSIPGEYDVVFEASVSAMKAIKVPVKSANKTTGVISGRRPSISLSLAAVIRMDVTVHPEPGHCIVTCASKLRTLQVTDWGANGRAVDGFFEALLPLVAPLADVSQAGQNFIPSGGQSSSDQYSNQPLRSSVFETRSGKVAGLTLAFILLCVVLSFAVLILTIASFSGGVTP